MWLWPDTLGGPESHQLSLNVWPLCVLCPQQVALEWRGRFWCYREQTRGLGGCLPSTRDYGQDRPDDLESSVYARHSLLEASVVHRSQHGMAEPVWGASFLSPCTVVHSVASSGLFVSFFSLILSVFSFQLLNRKDKTTFEKLDYLMSKEDNYKRTREYIRSLKMVPSIPYLGRSMNRFLCLCDFFFLRNMLRNLK